MEGKEEFSSEANEQMLSFLRDMEELQRNNPDAFNEILNSMGVTDDPSKDSGLPSMKRQSVIDAISQLRDADNGVVSGLELPGGKGTLSADGVKNKVSGQTTTPPLTLSADERDHHHSRARIYNQNSKRR
jgi:hypothetical protein